MVLISLVPRSRSARACRAAGVRCLAARFAPAHGNFAAKRIVGMHYVSGLDREDGAAVFRWQPGPPSVRGQRPSVGLPYWPLLRRSSPAAETIGRTGRTA